MDQSWLSTVRQRTARVLHRTVRMTPVPGTPGRAVLPASRQPGSRRGTLHPLARLLIVTAGCGGTRARRPVERFGTGT